MSEELDLKEILKFILQKRNIFIYILIASLLIGVIYSFIIKIPQYEINTQILIDKADASIADFIVSRDILNQENITAEFNKTNKTISILITSTKDKTQEALNNMNKYITNLQAKLEETYDIENFTIIETPQIPTKASNINYIKDIGIFVAIGIVMYVIYMMIALSLRGVTTRDEIEELVKIKLLGKVNLEIKNGKNLNIKNKEIVEQFKRIQANIELNKENMRPKTILLTGTEKGTGTSYITKKLAEQYTKLYNKVLIIDTDIIKEKITKMLLNEQKQGLTDVFVSNKLEQIESLIIQLNNEKLFILPKGIESMGEEIFLKETFLKILENLKQKYDIILIDSISINENITPIALTSIVDSTVIVVEKEKTKLEDILEAKKTIENVGGKISGVILNKMV